ncbi:MAG TPA: hypothetical protein VG713_05090, partial [Pirellulales bacterium]|nr:hypothetical protein [Pirellulales bacterium]
VLGGLRSELTELRQQAMARVAHRRTPEIMANLYLGLKYFLDFALTVHAISGQEKSEFLNRAWLALEEATASQIDHVQVADPVSHFLRLLSAVLASGRAHCAAPTGREPANPSAWGWRQNSSSVGDSWNGWRAQGQRIGWTEGDDLFLEPEVAYAAVQELANSQGDSLPIAPVTLRKRLKDKGLLVSAEAGKLTTRRTLDGQRRMVIHLKTDVVCGEKSGESGE